MKTKKLILSLFALLSLSLAACGGDNGTVDPGSGGGPSSGDTSSGGGGGTVVPVTGVTLNRSTLEITVGQTGTLTATVAPNNATDKTLSWATSAPTVATVSNGVVSALAVGTATITVASVADPTKTATCTVTVNAAPDDHTTPITVGYAYKIGNQYFSLNTATTDYDTQDGAWEGSFTANTGDEFSFFVDGVLIPVKSDGESTSNNIIEEHPYDEAKVAVHIKSGGSLNVYLKHWSDSNEYTFWISGIEPGGGGGSEEPTTTSFYIRSSAHSWATSPEYQLQTHDPDIGYIRVELDENEEFVIADDGWDHKWGYYWDRGAGNAKNIFGSAADYFSVDSLKEEGDDGYNNIICTKDGTYDIYLNNSDEIWVFEYVAPLAKTYYAYVGGEEVDLTPMEGEAPEGFVSQYSGEFSLDDSGVDPDMSFSLYYKLEGDDVTKHYIAATPSGSDTEHNVYNNYKLEENLGYIRKGTEGTNKDTIYLKVSNTEYYECFVTGGPSLPNVEYGYYFLSNNLNNFDLYSGVELKENPDQAGEYTVLDGDNNKVPLILETNTKFQIVHYTAEGITWFGSEKAETGTEDNKSAYGLGYLVPENGSTNVLTVVPGAYSIYFNPTKGEGQGLWTVRENTSNGLFLYSKDTTQPNFITLPDEFVVLGNDHNHYQHSVAGLELNETTAGAQLKFKLGSNANPFGIAGKDVTLADGYETYFTLNAANDTLIVKDGLDGTLYMFFVYEVKGINAEVTIYLSFNATRTVFLPNSINEYNAADNNYRLTKDGDDDNHYYFYIPSATAGFAFKIYDSNIEGEEDAKWIANNTEGKNYTLDGSGNMVLTKDGEYYINYYVNSEGDHVSVYKEPAEVHVSLLLGEGFYSTGNHVYAWAWGGQYSKDSDDNPVPGTIVAGDSDEIIISDDAEGFILLTTVDPIDEAHKYEFPTAKVTQSIDITDVRSGDMLVCKGLDSVDNSKYYFEYITPLAARDVFLPNSTTDPAYKTDAAEFKLTQDTTDQLGNHYYIDLNDVDAGFAFKIYDNGIDSENPGDKWIANATAGNHYTIVDGNMSLTKDGDYRIHYYVMSDGNHIVVDRDPVDKVVQVSLGDFSANEENVYAWAWGGNFGNGRLVPVTKVSEEYYINLNDEVEGFKLVKTNSAVPEANYNSYPEGNVAKESADIPNVRTDAVLTYKGNNIFKYVGDTVVNVYIQLSNESTHNWLGDDEAELYAYVWNGKDSDPAYYRLEFVSYDETSPKQAFYRFQLNEATDNILVLRLAKGSGTPTSFPSSYYNKTSDGVIHVSSSQYYADFSL